MKIRTAIVIVCLLVPWTASAAPSIRFDFRAGFEHIKKPKLDGLHVVEKESDPADYVVHAKLEWSFNKPIVAVWLDPGIEEANATYVKCARYPNCSELTTFKDSDIENLLYMALDQALFQDQRGLGVLMIAGCTPESTRAIVGVTSAKNVGLDSHFYYVVTRINKNGRLVIGESSQYELELVERHSDVEGVFEPASEPEETMKLVNKICAKPKRDDGTGYPLMVQLRPPALRWEVQMPNARTQ